MFARAISLSLLALPLLVTAIALPGGGGDQPPPPPPPSCAAGTGSLTCCDSTEAATDLGPVVTALFLLLGIVLDAADLEALVGVTCTPIVGSVSCTQQTVCCTDDSFHGLVAIGCTNINL